MIRTFTFLLALLCAAGLRAQCTPDVQCPATLTEYLDYTTNDPLLWHSSDWLDPVLATTDLGEAPVSIILQAENVCGTGLIAHLDLRLDLDGDGVRETELDSDSLGSYPAGQIPYGNLLPNYDGALRTFDLRPVPAGDKYRFALVATAVNTANEFRLVWTTDNAPDQYVIPQLPTLNDGNHAANWLVTDANANAVWCNDNFTVRDGKKPTVVCLNGLSVNFMPTGMITLWATDFLLYGEDNLTPTAQLKYGVRKSGTGTGFPIDAAGNPLTSITFNCQELGTRFVELWAIDAAGNADFCETYVLLQDNLGACSGTSLDSLQVCFENCCNGQPSPVEDIEIHLFGNPNGVPIPSIFGAWTQLPGPDNCYAANFVNTLPLATDYFIVPEKDGDPLEGVTTFDLLLMQRHILGLEPFGAACQYLAADANRSNSITTFDIVELRKLVLGIYSELPNNTSWRFIYKDTTLGNPGNPFLTPWQEQVAVNSLANPDPDPFVFWPVKIGDVSCAEPVAGSELALCVPDLALEAGDTVQVPVSFAEAAAIFGLQLDLQYSAQLTLLDLDPGILPDLFGASANFAADHRLTISWPSSTLTNVLPSDPLFYLVFKVEQPTLLAQALSLGAAPLVAEAYDDSLRRRPLVLDFCTPSSTGNPAGLALGAARPNPAPLGTPVIVPVHATEPSEARYEIIDLAGRVLVAGQIQLAAGTTQLAIPTANIRQAGLYLYRIEAGSASHLGKIMFR